MATPRPRRVGGNGFPACVIGLVLMLAFAPIARAQNTSSGSIGGLVTDEQNLALPGVTVTASSPALLVQQRTLVTDERGEYRFADLPPGVYALRFELAGFRTVVRDQLQLTAGFAARINMALNIGSLEDAIVVSGAAPVLDPTSTGGGRTIQTTQLVTELPGNKTMADLVSLSPGVVNTAGENPGSLGLDGRPRFATYGLGSGNNSTVKMDGFLVIANNPVPDVGSTQEVDVKTFGNGAEQKEPGISLNMIIKSGGNAFHGSGTSAYMKAPSSNVDDALRARNLPVGPQQKYFYDSSVDLGGRVLRDRLWFYAAYRKRLSEQSQPGLVRNAGPDGRYLTGDEPAAFPKLTGRNVTAKFTYQVSKAYQALVYMTRDLTTNEADIQIAPFGAPSEFSNTPWEATNPFDWRPKITKGEFKGTPTSTTLFNAQFGFSGYILTYGIQPEAIGVPTMYNRNTSVLTGSNIPHVSDSAQNVLDSTFTWLPESFLGGKHEFKVGVWGLWDFGASWRPTNPAGDYALLFDTVNGVPNVAQEFESNNAPTKPKELTEYYSAFVQDQWRLGRLTFNLGVRMDYQHLLVPAQSREAGMFAEARSFNKIEIGKWWSIGPRAAFAWDITGSGKTVLKSTYGKFHPAFGAGNFNPNTSYTTRYRWRDLNLNGDYDPGEVNLDTNGPDYVSGGPVALTTRINPDLQAPNAQEFTTTLEREVIPGIAVRALYLVRTQGNETATVNVLRPYSAYNIQLARRDPGPDGIINTGDDGGMVTIWDYDPAFRGSAFVANTTVNRAPERRSWSHSFEVGLAKNFSRAWSVNTSFSLNKRNNWFTSVVQTPNDQEGLKDRSLNWNYKVNGNYTAPYGIGLGAIVEMLSAPRGTRTYVFRSADPLGGPALRQLSTVTQRLGEVNAIKEKAYALLNLRASKKFTLGSKQWQVSLDVLNALNSNAVKAATYASGPTFGNVTNIVPPRQFRVGGQFQF
jgi:hypothetical protein